MPRRYQCTIELDNDFDQLFKDVKLELDFGDLDHTAIQVCCMLKVAGPSRGSKGRAGDQRAEQGIKGPPQVRARLCHKGCIITEYIHVYDIILSFNQEAQVETTTFLLHQLATEQQPIAKPSAGNKSITSSFRKKKCGQCVGCRTPNCGEKLFCTNKEKWGCGKIAEMMHSLLEVHRSVNLPVYLHVLHPHNHSPVHQNLPKPINHMRTKQTAKLLSSSQQYVVTGHSTTSAS